MQKAYFAKISDSMSWNILREKIAEQKRNKAQPLPFKIIAEINISSIDFDKLSLSIRTLDILYIPCTSLSVATSGGIWNCILIRCSNDSRNVLIYTSGNIYPLYASIINE